MDRIKQSLASLRFFIATAAGFVGFLFIMSVVGNPHVAETFFAVAVGLIVFVVVLLKLPKNSD